MKIRSLLIGSVAAAGLSTGAFAADLGVLTSLDVCDALGLSGLTISSDTNCLQITGGVSYEFNWGDYRRSANFDSLPSNPWADADDGTNDFPVQGAAPAAVTATGNDEYVDYDTKVEAWLRVVGTADSDFGPAKAVIGIHEVDKYRLQNGGYTSENHKDGPPIVDPTDGHVYGTQVNGDTTNGVELNEAYVSVGDATVITAGLRKDGKDGSVGNFDDDTPFNYLGLFGSSITSSGVLFKDGAPIFGGMSIQVESDLGNGVLVGVGLENIDNTDGSNNDGVEMLDPQYAGTLLGVVQYAGESLTAHLTGGAIGVLDGDTNQWFIHAGGTGTFDNFKLRAAGAYLHDDDTDADYWHAIVSGQASFDMFTLALSGEYKSSEVGATTVDGWGVGGSIGAQVTDTVALNLGGRYFRTDDGTTDWDQWQIEAQLVASITETIKATAAVGVYGGDIVEGSLDPAGGGAITADGIGPALSGDDTAYYGSLGLAWTPGGDFTASVNGLVNSEGAYKATFKASKSFQ